MFKIRREQREMFATAGAEAFERSMLVHLRECFPERCQRLGDEAIAAAVARGIERAQRHGLVTERDLCKYLSLVFALGEGFDGDGGVPLASSILSRASLSPSARLDEVYAVAIEHLRRSTRDAEGET